MDYEKKYKEVLERAKESLKDGGISQNSIDYIQSIFPELKESEDDRIRKSLIILLQHFCKGYRVSGLNFSVSYKDMLAWLEKQGEQEQDPCEHCKDKCLNCHNFPCIEKRAFEQGKSVFDVINEEKVDNANKVEPKFKVGDWLCENESNKYARFIQILETVSVPDKEGYYKISRDLYNDEDIIDFNFVEKFYHKFDIKNAKDGDVLSDGTTIFIFKDLLSDSSVISHCDYDTDSGESDVFCPLSMNLICSKITPATKEQRDILFQKMKESGYEWNVDKKELKKIEKQGEQKEYTFKSLPRLLDMIEPTSKAKVYCQKLINTLINEGYAIDAKIVGECLKQMNGEKVALATMDKKQSEQNHTDKVEPKFKVGDWITNGATKPAQISSIEDDMYYTHNGTIGGDIESMDKDYHLWTIEDAKDGDVLATIKGGVFIYAKVLYNKPYAYCGVDKFGVFKDNCLNNNWTNSVDNIHPATKEQHDLLFSKMKEVGYEWDAEKKELRVEQKSADKVKPKFKVGDWCIDNEDGTIFQIVKVLDNTYIYKTNEGKEYSCTHYSLENDARLWTIQDAKDGDVLTTYTGRPFIFKGCLDERHLNSPVAYCGVNYDNCFFVSSGISWWTDENVHPATKEQRDTLMKAIADAGYVFDFEKKELKLLITNGGDFDEKNCEQKHSIDINKMVDDYANNRERGNEEFGKPVPCMIRAYRQGLNDAIGKVVLKPAWSEEDIRNIQDIDSVLFYDKSLSEDTCMRLRNWLESLRPQNTWKPSDEQMNALRNLNLTGGISYTEQGQTLIELYNDLKKLREE